jgi:hypothetical protein
VSDPVRHMLEAVRHDLRNVVLPKIEGDYERSIVIAMLGILGDLTKQVSRDEKRLAVEAELLRVGAAEWAELLRAGGAVAHASEVDVAAAAATSEPVPSKRREHFLELAETIIRALWAEPSMAAVRDEVLPTIRKTLKQTLS